MRKNSLKAKIIVQSKDTVMVPTGQTPVLVVPDEGRFGYEWMKVLATAINFLNCDCPSVTIWSPEIERLCGPDEKEKFAQEIRERLVELLPFDPFRFLVDPLHNWATDPEKFKGTVLIVRRTGE